MQAESLYFKEDQAVVDQHWPRLALSPVVPATVDSSSNREG